MTSRAWPLDRDDFARRTLRFEIEPSRGQQLVGKEVLFPAAQAVLPRMRAEILLRCQNILRAYQQDAPVVSFASEMIEYEQFAYRCAAFEGTLDATRELWGAIRDQSKVTLTDTSPIVQAMRLFIGKRAGRAKRIGVTELFASLQTVAHETGQTLPFKAANRLGHHLRNSGPSLAAIGVIYDRDDRGAFVSIEPAAWEIERCVSMYGYFRHENLNRVAPYLASPNKPDENIVDEEANRSLETAFHDTMSDMDGAA